MVKRIRIILTALSGCIQLTFSCFQVISLWASSFTYLFDIRTGETPSSASICFHLHTRGRTDALQLTKIAELISSNKGTDDSWEPFLDKYMVPFIHLQNTIPKNTLDKIAFTPWLRMSASGKGSSTPSLNFLFLLKQSLTFWERLTQPTARSFPPHLLCYRYLQLVTSTGTSRCSIRGVSIAAKDCKLHFPTILTLGMGPSPPFSQFKPLWAFTFPNSTQSPGDHSQRNTQLERRLRKKLEVVLHHRCPNHTAKTRKAHWGGNGRKKFPHF